MKTLTRLLTLLGITVLILSSCSKKYYVCEPVTEEDPHWPWNITAEWEQESVKFDLEITSNIDQLAIDFTTPSEDSITAQISDEISTSLKYLQSSLGDSNIILAQNQSIGSESFPLHELVIVYFGEADSGVAVYSITDDGASESEDYSGLIQFSFNTLDYHLTVSSQTLYNSDSTQTVLLNGSINIQTNPLIADNPISVPITLSQTNTTIILNPSGEYFRLTHDGSGVPDEAEGTWEVTDTTANTITIIETYQDWELGTTITDTLDISYTFDSDTLTFAQPQDPCDGYADEAECFGQYELDFGLTENSITALGLNSTMVFTKATSGKRKPITNSHPAYWFGKTTYFKDLHSK